MCACVCDIQRIQRPYVHIVTLSHNKILYLHNYQ